MRLLSLRWSSVLALLLLCVLAAAWLMRGHRHAQPSGPIREIVSFGDSLSDVGTYVLPGSGDGLRFTTKPGEVWSEVVAQARGVELKPNQRVTLDEGGKPAAVADAGGTSYAQGGAHIDTDGQLDADAEPGENLPGAPALSIKTQIDRYLAVHKRFIDGQLVLIQGGTNDLLDAFQGLGDPAATDDDNGDDQLESLVEERARAMAAQVRRLLEAGARRVVYVNLPDLGMLPFIRNTELEDLATDVSDDYNQLVASALENSGVRVLDFAGFIDDIVDDPAPYGITMTDKPACTSFDKRAGQVDVLRCTADTLVEPDADQHYLFADSMHLTAAGHRLWGRKVVETAASPAR